MSDKTPMPDFDWVTARCSCSVAQLFEKLRLQVKKDVETREVLRQRPQEEHFTFRFVSNGHEFSALVEGNKIHHSVIFSLTHQAIAVRNENDMSMFRAFVTLNDEGRCLVRIKDKEYELWQMRKMALEPLLFGEY